LPAISHPSSIRSRSLCQLRPPSCLTLPSVVNRCSSYLHSLPAYRSIATDTTHRATEFRAPASKWGRSRRSKERSRQALSAFHTRIPRPRGLHDLTMRFHLAPAPLLHLITTILLTPITTANPAPALSAQAGFDFNDLYKRWDCTGQLCGWNNQLCCPNGGCYTNALQQAQCTGGGYSASAAPASPSSAAAGGGYWQAYTTVYAVTNAETITSVYSTYVGGSVSAAASSSPSGAARCNYALNESPCGDICCSGTQYCFKWGQCAAAAGSETTTTKAGIAGAPIRPTSSGVTVVTATQSPTTTIPFQTPVATGANVTMTAVHSSSGGLSGGAIAGIVIGVLVGLLILGLICFYCCIKGLLDGCLALFGLGGRKKRRTEVEEYERHSHHASGGGGRTWYGASKPSRVEKRKESHTGRNVMGGLAGLAGLWAVLGLKRKRNERRGDGKQSEYSYSSDYYTSSSE